MSQLSDSRRFCICQLVEDDPEWKMKDMQREFPKFFEGVSKRQLENTIKNIKETRLRVRMEGTGGPVVGNEVEKEVEKLLQSDKISGRKHKSPWEVEA